MEDMSLKPGLQGNSHVLEEIWTEVCRAVRTKKCTKERRKAACPRQRGHGMGSGGIRTGGQRGVGGTGMRVGTEIQGGVRLFILHLSLDT